MSWYAKFLAGTFPDYQMRRMRAQQVTNAYESAKPGRTHKAKRESRGANLPVGEAAKPIREQVRYLEQNTDIINGALDVLCANVVGAGIRPEPQVRNQSGELLEDFNTELADLYTEWSRRPEVTWEHDEASAQRLMARSLFRDGEVFYQHLTGTVRGLDHGTEVPYSYEMIEGDLIPLDLTDTRRKIVQGVEMNAWRRPVAYHLFKSNPNDLYSLDQMLENTKRVPAARMQHIKIMRRINQVRGISLFASVLRRLADIEEIDESERVAARIAAALAFYIKKGEPMTYAPPADNEDGYRELEFRPGMVFDDLEPGEDMGSIGSNRPNNELIPFRQEQLRSAAGATMTSYSSLSKNYNGTYSAQRQELVEQSVIYRMVWSYFVARAEMPKWSNFIRAARLARVIEVPGDVDERTLLTPMYSPPALPWIDPMKEAAAWEKLNASKFESREHIIRSRGRDPREVERQLAREQNNAQAESEDAGERETESEDHVRAVN